MVSVPLVSRGNKDKCFKTDIYRTRQEKTVLFTDESRVETHGNNRRMYEQCCTQTLWCDCSQVQRLLQLITLGPKRREAPIRTTQDIVLLV